MYLLILLPMQDLLYSYPYLHPTMYLLILPVTSCVFSSFLHLHPTMYLLILEVPLNLDIRLKFTSHYVSINSQHRAYA